MWLVNISSEEGEALSKLIFISYGRTDKTICRYRFALKIIYINNLHVSFSSSLLRKKYYVVPVCFMLLDLSDSKCEYENLLCKYKFKSAFNRSLPLIFLYLSLYHSLIPFPLSISLSSLFIFSLSNGWPLICTHTYTSMNYHFYNTV